MEKKSERLEVRLGYEEKEMFTEACGLQGDTPSEAVRRFIRGYVRRSDRDVLSSVWRASGKRKIPKIALAIVLTGIIATIVWGTGHSLFNESDSEIFANRDRDQNGVLSGDELGPVMNDFLYALDIDASGEISEQEFRSKGKVIYAFTGPKDDQKNRFKPRNGFEDITLFKFKVSSERIVSGTYSVTSDITKTADKIVVWHEGGDVTVLGPAQTLDLEAMPAQR